MIPVSPVLIRDPEAERLYAKDQPQYLTMPALRSQDGIVTTRWKLSFRERLSVLLSGHVWLQLMTFNGAPQPSKILAKEPPIEEVL